MSKALSSISNFNFCIFAMGDSSYTKFNWIGLQLARRFEQLGCNLIFPVVSCDERHELGYDFTADVGIAQLSEYAIQHEIGDFNNVIQYKPRFPICSSKEVQISKGVKSSDSNFIGKVLINDRVTAEDHFQETRLIRFSIEGSYDPGDVINIKPCNPDGYVDMVFDAFDQWDRDSVVSWSSDCTIPGLNLPMTLGQLIKEEVDLVGIPRRHFFCILAEYSTDAIEKERLLEFCASDGTDDRWDYANRPRRSLSEALADFPKSIKTFPFEALFELFPLIRPRPYSICSYSSNYAEILCAIVRYRSRMARPRIGLCSNYLKHLCIGDAVTLYLTKGTFRLPSDGPLIMIGPGTGVAPFRSILQHRQVQKSLVLFFGCRSPKTDLYFENEFNELTRINAFSRDKIEPKQYVQDAIEKNASLVWSQIMAGAPILIAGKAMDMPDQVKSAIKNVMQTEGTLDAEQSEQFLSLLEDQGRLQQETW